MGLNSYKKAARGAFKTEYNTEILYLRRYFHKSYENPLETQLTYMINHENNKDIKAMLETWQSVIKTYILQTDVNLLKVIKVALVFGYETIQEAGNAYLFYQKSQTYRTLTAWLQGLRLAFFKAR